MINVEEGKFQIEKENQEITYLRSTDCDGKLYLILPDTTIRTPLPMVATSTLEHVSLDIPEMTLMLSLQ